MHETVAAIYRWHEQRASEPARPYLGCSEAGHKCARYLWLRFRWAAVEQFSGRMYRLFQTGHLMEPRFIEELEAIGVTVSAGDGHGNQHAVEACGGHMRGHLDGALLGLMEAPKTWHVAEFKTHNDKSFKELVAKGVKEAKPMHYAQMQLYMALTGMERAAYFATNKNTDEIYMERVHYDTDEAKRLLDRAASIIFATEPPPRLSERPDWYECKLCRFHGICHGTQAPDVNCRTCAHSTPTQGGTWTCEKYGEQIPDEPQRVGCTEHRYIPILLERFAEQTNGSDAENWVQYRHKETGNTFVNGAQGYSSREIHAAADKRVLGDAGVDELKKPLAPTSLGDGETLEWKLYSGGRHLGLYRHGKWIQWVPQTPDWIALVEGAELGT
jgi:hypothetical protein